MGVDLEVMAASQKRRVTLPNGETVTVYGYRTCPRGESRPSSWLHKYQDAQDQIVERATGAVEKHKPRYIVGLGFGDVVKNKGKKKRVFEWEEGRLVLQVEEGHDCPVAWWDTKPAPNTKPIGFLKKVGNRWHIVARIENSCNSTTWDDQGRPVKRNRHVEYVENGEYKSHSYWKDEASTTQAPSRLAGAVV